MPNRTTELVVIGAGAMRTGTVSQKTALEILLGQPCYHMGEVFRHPRRNIALWLQATDTGLTKPLAEQLIQGYAAGVDYPVAAFYRELMHHYPNAKVVLSVRDAKGWVDSVQGAILNSLVALDSLPRPLLWVFGAHNFTRMVRSVVRRDLGPDADLANTELMMRKFEERNEAVRRAVPPERLLEFRVSDGWGPLCKFLDLPVPDVPFPRLNDRESVQRALKMINIVSYAVNAVMSLGAVGLGVWAYRRFLR